MTHTLAPQTEQTPIKVNGFCTGGVAKPPADGQGGSVGYWCYDDEGLAGMQALVDQCTEAGVDIMVLSLNMNNTWRSSIANEFVSDANVTWFKQVVDQAHVGHVEIGAYQLLLHARSATALNQAAPRNAATLPNAGYDCMDPTSMLTCHNQNHSGSCSMCGATKFYDAMEHSMHDWWRRTGVSVVAQDGAESTTPCANESHSNHHGLNDSVWEQYKAVRRTFNAYLTTPMHEADGLTLRNTGTSSEQWSVPTVGFIAGMPGSIMEAGEAKVPGGYSEMTFSLPRWTWIDMVRESIIAGANHRDFDTPIGSRMFPIPFSGPYHPTEAFFDPATNVTKWKAVVGYDSTATLSPLEDHLVEIEWALSTYFGTGAFANMRAHKLWDGPNSKKLVKQWIAWAKHYRRVLSAESTTLRHGTVCWTGEPTPDSHCNHTGLDAVLHRAPAAYYADIEERALAMVWNPTRFQINTTIPAPLYYAGLSHARGVHAVNLSWEGHDAAVVPLGANDTIMLSVALAPRTFTWFVVTE